VVGGSDDMITEQSSFRVEPVKGAVYMQVGWERCRKMMDVKSRAEL